MKSVCKSSIYLSVQSAYKVFCYFNVSPFDVKRFEDSFGPGSWGKGVPVLRIYMIDENLKETTKDLYINPFADNWFINLDKGGLSLHVKLLRKYGEKFAGIAYSNTVLTPSLKEDI